MGVIYKDPSQSPVAGDQFAHIDAILKQIQASNQQSQPQQPKKIRGRGGFLSSLISEIGGAGGAVGGAAAGTALLPGIGTVIGAGLGGLLGGTTGRGIENKVRDNQKFFGAGGSARSAFGEGALSGVLGAGGEALTALKGAKAAGVGLKEAFNPGTAQAVRQAGIEAPGILSRIAGNAKQDVVNPIVKASPFAAQEEKAITDTVNKYVGGLSAKGKYENLGKAFKGLDSQIAGKLEGVAGTTTTDAVKKTITNGLQQDLRFVPGDTTYENALKRVLTRVDSQATDGKLTASDLFKVKQYLNTQIGKTFEQGSPAAIQQQVARVVRDGLDAEISRVAPAVKTLTVAQSRLYEAAPGLQKAAAKTAGIPIVGLKSRAAERGIQASKSLAAIPTGAAGAVVDSTLGRALKTQLVPRGALALNGLTDNQGSPQVDTQQQPQQIPDLQQSAAPTTEQPSQPTYGLQNALQDAYGLLGPKQSASTYLSYAKELMNQNNPTDTKTSQAQQTNQDNLLTALSSLDSAETNLVDTGGAKGPALGQLSTLPLVGQVLNHQGAAFHNTRIETATQLAKALTGSTRPAKEVIMYYLHSLPDVTDTPQYAASKIALLRNDILRRAQATGTDISSYTGQQLPAVQPSSGLQSAIGNLGTGKY